MKVQRDLLIPILTIMAKITPKMEYRINGKTYKSLDQVPGQFRGLFVDSNGDGIPDLFRKMGEMSPADFDKFLNENVPKSEVSYDYASGAITGSASFSSLSSTKFLAPDTENLFPEVPDFKVGQGKGAGSSNLQEVLEDMRVRRDKSGAGSPQAKTDHVMLEPEEEVVAPLNDDAPLALEIPEPEGSEGEQGGTGMWSGHPQVRLEVPAGEEDDVSNDRVSSRGRPSPINIPLEPAVITLICRCGFVRKTVFEEYKKDERCPECFRILHVAK